jgi:CheY-like chemotaxis protein
VVLREWLGRRLGFAVEEAADGDEAVSRVRERGAGAFAVVVLDLMMPRMRGDRAAALLRDELGFRGRLVCATGNPELVDRPQTFDAVLHKPYPFEAFVRALGDVVDK